MAIGGPGDGLLTRDAATVEEYIALMSDEAAAAEEAEAIGGEPPVTQQRHQVRRGTCGRRTLFEECNLRNDQACHLPRALP